VSVGCHVCAVMINVRLSVCPSVCLFHFMSLSHGPCCHVHLPSVRPSNC